MKLPFRKATGLRAAAAAATAAEDRGPLREPRCAAGAPPAPNPRRNEGPVVGSTSGLVATAMVAGSARPGLEPRYP